MRRTIVISAVNLVEGGPLAILQECLDFVADKLAGEYEIIALVNGRNLLKSPRIEYIELPEAKKNWVNRLFYEFFYFKRLSARLDPWLWLSLHDITPNVKAGRLAVYCHNASPFYAIGFKDVVLDPRFAMFRFFYKYLYAINIRKNYRIIVQQEWMRRRMADMFGLDNVIVAHPASEFVNSPIQKSAKSEDRRYYTFFYPSFPRVFKNFEVICRAARHLIKNGESRFRIILTISGKENWYTAYIRRSYGKTPNIEFIGLQSRDEVARIYSSSDCLIFPSKLETWGLPVCEAKSRGIPIFIADLEYARETLGVYDKAAFFHPDDHKRLADLMAGLMNGEDIFAEKKAITPSAAAAAGWDGMFRELLRV